MTREAPVAIAACAPLWNVAHFVSLSGVEQIVMAGGELAPAREPECNVAHDATSAERVLASGTPLTVVDNSVPRDLT